MKKDLKKFGTDLYIYYLCSRFTKGSNTSTFNY